MKEPIKVLILDDHQAIIDGYVFRLSNLADIQIVETLNYAERLEGALEEYKVDVLILDVQVPISMDNMSPYPIMYVIPKLIDQYPDMSILVISMHDQRTMVRSIMEAGANGYILKDDRAAMVELPTIIRLLHNGGFYISQRISKLLKEVPDDKKNALTPRQIEVLSYCAAYPEASTLQISKQMGVAHSTVRNLLSGAYLKLDVPNRTAALAKARQMGLLLQQD
ncbi:MAG: response regulator transcription factor [Anaerolineae bacterium]|nr:response regulator transcription factor [Anaerolineae bacterium]